MSDFIITILGVILGIGGTALTFCIPPKELFWATASGFLGWEVMTGLRYYDVDTLSATALGALTVQLAAEILARDRKKPASIYVVPGIMPLVPGRAIYVSMLYLLAGKYTSAISEGAPAIVGAGGIAIGMLIGSAIAKLWHNPVTHLPKQQKILPPKEHFGFWALKQHVAESVRQHRLQEFMHRRLPLQFSQLPHDILPTPNDVPIPAKLRTPHISHNTAVNGVNRQHQENKPQYPTRTEQSVVCNTATSYKDIQQRRQRHTTYYRVCERQARWKGRHLMHRTKYNELERENTVQI